MANASQAHLSTLQTPFGARNVYDSVCYCNRCGVCANACPSYRQRQQEPFSPRGRNQILRQLLTGKLKAKREHKLLQKVLASCTLCGHCVQHCPGQIPTPQHMLELRRRLGISLLPRTLVYLLRLRQTTPQLFAFIVKSEFFLRRTGCLKLISYVSGFTWLKHALEILPSTVKISMGVSVENPTLIYLPSLEAEFFMPALFKKTYQLAAQKHNVTVWQNTSSGLFEYVYGDLRRARKLVRAIITRHANIKGGTLPILTDSIDVYNFLIRSAELFVGFPTFEQKARDFAACVRYVTDLFPSELTKGSSFPIPVKLYSGAIFSQETLPQQKARQILSTLFEKNFVQCGYKDETVPPLGCGFVVHTSAPAYSVSAVRTIAAHQIQTVFVLSGLTALELAFYVRKFYPVAQARHIVELGDSYAKISAEQQINS